MYLHTYVVIRGAQIALIIIFHGHRERRYRIFFVKFISIIMITFFSLKHSVNILIFILYSIVQKSGIFKNVIYSNNFHL